MLQFQLMGLEMGLYNYLPLPIKNKGKIARCNENPFIILIIKPHSAHRSGEAFDKWLAAGKRPSGW